jgi:hypothetical protein
VCAEAFERPTNTCVDCPSNVVIDAGHLQSTGDPVTVLQLTTTPPGDLCPDELWISLIDIESEGDEHPPQRGRPRAAAVVRRIFDAYDRGAGWKAALELDEPGRGIVLIRGPRSRRTKWTSSSPRWRRSHGGHGQKSGKRGQEPRWSTNSA